MHPFFALGRIRIPAWGTLAALGAAAGLGLCLRLLPKGRRRDGGIVLLWALAGAGVSLSPAAFLLVGNGQIRCIPVQNDLILQIGECLRQFTERKEGEGC